MSRRHSGVTSMSHGVALERFRAGVALVTRWCHRDVAVSREMSHRCRGVALVSCDHDADTRQQCNTEHWIVYTKSVKRKDQL